MLAELGNSLYRTTTIVAGVILVIVLAALFYSAAHGDAYLQITAVLIAGFIWLVGRVCKLVLAGR
jgi:fucose permease